MTAAEIDYGTKIEQAVAANRASPLRTWSMRTSRGTETTSSSSYPFYQAFSSREFASTHAH